MPRAKPRHNSLPHPSRKPIRVLLIDERRLLRTALRMLLDREPTIRVTGEADEAVAVLPKTACATDVFVIHLPYHDRSRLSAIRELQANVPAAKLLALTDRHDPTLWSEAIQSGVAGIVGTHESPAALIQAIVAVRAGELWLERALLARTLATLLHPSHPGPEKVVPFLTAREQTILNHLAAGLTNKQIALQINLSDITVRHYLTTLYNKCGISNRCELLTFAYHHGLCELPQ